MKEVTLELLIKSIINDFLEYQKDSLNGEKDIKRKKKVRIRNKVK